VSQWPRPAKAAVAALALVLVTRPVKVPAVVAAGVAGAPAVVAALALALVTPMVLDPAIPMVWAVVAPAEVQEQAPVPQMALAQVTNLAEADTNRVTS
jgi:hypothetical protein